MLHCIYIRSTNSVYIDIFIHVAICPLIVIHPCLVEFPVVNLVSSFFHFNST